MNETLDRLHQRFINYSLAFKGNSEVTVSGMESMFYAFLRFSNATTIADFTLDSVEDWMCHGRTERKWSPKTMRLHRCYLSLFADWCVRKELMPSNFVKTIPKPRLPKTIPEALSEEECETLLAWVRNYPYRYKFERMRAIAIFSIFLGTGIRLAELYNLKLEDVDLVSQELFVRQGKGSKDRWIPFRPSVARALDNYLIERKRLKKCSPYFFSSLRYDTKMGDQVVRSLVVAIRSKSGIRFTAHKLRHTFATRMLQNGMDVRSVQELLGHADLATTAIYLAATDRHIREQVLTKGFDV